MKFRTKPCEIEATKWTGRNVAEIMRFVKNESAIITKVDEHTFETEKSIIV